MTTIRYAITLLLAFVALAACISTASAQPSEPAVRMQPANVQVAAGETTQFTIEISEVENLGAFQFDLTWDPAIVRVDSIALGNFPASTGRMVNPLGPKMEAGRAVYGAFSLGDAAGPDGSGTLAVVTLQTQAGGQTPIGLQNVQVIDIAGTRIPVSTAGGTVAVSGSPPAPGPAVTAVTGEPMGVTTATAETLLSSLQRDATTEESPGSTFRDWAVTVGALIVVVALVVLAARLMAR